MTNDKTTNQRDFIEYRFNEVFKRLDRMEGKMDNLAFTKQTEFNDFKAEVRIFMKETTQAFNRMRNYNLVEKVVFTMIGLMCVGVGGAIISGVIR